MLPALEAGARKEPLLEYWEVLPDGRYQGQVFGRAGYEDGDTITTGTVTQTSNTHIITASGTKYKLGRPVSRKRNQRASAPNIKPKEDILGKAFSEDDRAGKSPSPKDDDPSSRIAAGRRGTGGANVRRPDANGDAGRNGQVPTRAVAKPRPPSGNDNLLKPQRDGYAKPRIGGNEETPVPARGRRAPAGRQVLDATAMECKQDVYVGDRVRVCGTGGTRGSQGEVMYVGPAEFANGRKVCGIKLDKPQLGSLHDGKERGGERYFRCEPGHGCYVLLEDVELIGRPGQGLLDDSNDIEPPFNVDEALDKLVGMLSAKQHLKSLRNRLEVGRRREVFGVKDSKPLHTIFVGSLGMDFLGITKVLAGILKEAQVSKTLAVQCVGRKDIVGTSTDATGKLCDEVMAKAKGGVLLVTDASGIVSGGGKDREDFYGSMALNKIVAAIDKTDGAKTGPPFVLVLGVRRDQLQTLLQASPTLAPATQVELAEYSLQETVALLRQAVTEAKFQLSSSLSDSSLSDLLSPILSRSAADKRGMILVEKMTEDAINRQTDRVFNLKTVSKESLLELKEVDFEPPPVEGAAPTEQVLARLDEVVGLAGVKDHVRALIAQLQLDQERRNAGLPGGGSRSTTLHMIFSGNPGTGKTTVARIIAEVLQSMGILRCGHCVETDRADLVAGYVGQTALKVHEVVQKALGGVLFVDEAYALVKDDKDQFGREALDTLIKLVEDYRDDLVVVLAGYPKEMQDMIGHNPGVKSRFPTVIMFDDYSVDELMQIADIVLGKSHMELGQGAREALESHCSRIASCKNADNGNGRAVRNIMEKAIRHQALRLVASRQAGQPPNVQELCLLKAEDFEFEP